MLMHGHAIIHLSVSLLLAIYILLGFAIKNNAAISIVTCFVFFLRSCMESTFCKNGETVVRNYKISNETLLVLVVLAPAASGKPSVLVYGWATQSHSHHLRPEESAFSPHMPSCRVHWPRGRCRAILLTPSCHIVANWSPVAPLISQISTIQV